MTVVDEALAVLTAAGREQFPGWPHLRFNATLAAAQELYKATRKPTPHPPELLAALERNGTDTTKLIKMDVEAELDYRKGWADIAVGVEGHQLFGYPFIIHEDGPARFWVSTTETDGKREVG